MRKQSEMGDVAPGTLQGARSATASAPSAAAEVKRWSALRGESVDAISREVAVAIFRLEELRDRALAGIDAGLKEREHDSSLTKRNDALANWSWKSRSCARRGRQVALWPGRGRRDESRDLASAGTEIGQGSALASSAAWS